MKQGLKQLAVLKIVLYVTAVLLIVVLIIGGAKGVFCGFFVFCFFIFCFSLKCLTGGAGNLHLLF